MTRKNKKTSPPKLSEAILRIAEPLIRKYPKRERIIVIVDLAVFAWNLSLTSGDKREEIEKIVIDVLPEDLDAADIASIIEQTDILIERKNELYPDTEYFVTGHHLSFGDNGQLTLDVSSVVKQK